MKIFLHGALIFKLSKVFDHWKCFGPTGFTPGNHFATITENLAEFTKACQDVLKKGSQKIIIKLEKE